MLSYPAAIKVYLCTVPCDMCRSFNGLFHHGQSANPEPPSPAHLDNSLSRKLVSTVGGPRGGMAEWFKAAVLKTVERKLRGFESYSLRQSGVRRVPAGSGLCVSELGFERLRRRRARSRISFDGSGYSSS